MTNVILVTGGAGFIGSCYVRRALAAASARIVVLDKLTYAGNLESLPRSGTENYQFIRGDISDVPLLRGLLADIRPQAVLNFAAETHVDRSIDGHSDFLQTNVVGAVSLLTACREYYEQLPEPQREQFRFLHVSTDEVYGSLGASGKFQETTPYAPEFALCGVESVFRHVCASLPSNVWVAHAGDQLLQQLRTLSVSRKADSTDDPQCPGSEAIAGLRRRAQRARLALCGGSL